MYEPWNPPTEISAAESKVLKLCKRQKIWSFLRNHRDRIVDDEVRQALASMYAESGRGKPVSPEQLALAMLLQVAFHVPDHEVPVLTAVDRRWQMVLGLLGAAPDEAAFSQGTVYHFRERAREHGLMTLLLDKTVRLARDTKGFSATRLRAMVDSSPLLGAGRVEDTFNLIGRAASQLVAVAALVSGRTEEELADSLALTVVSAPSVKAALDVDWRRPDARDEALRVLLEQCDRLRRWVEETFSESERGAPPLVDAVDLMDRLIAQDTEPDPDAPTSKTRRIIQGGRDRQISLSDPDMRHGRKSKTKLFTGYKRHVAVDADIPGLMLSVEVMPANATEHLASEPLLSSVEDRGFQVVELHIDRGYLASPAVHARRKAGMKLMTKPPHHRPKPGRLAKSDFEVDFASESVTCPDGQVAPLQGPEDKRRARFSRSVCTGCAFAEECLPKRGAKVVTLHRHEQLHREMAQELATAEGRAMRRERVLVDHALGRMGQIQGHKARYRGLEKNQFHAEASAVVANLHVLLRRIYEEAA